MAAEVKIVYVKVWLMEATLNPCFPSQKRRATAGSRGFIQKSIIVFEEDDEVCSLSSFW